MTSVSSGRPLSEILLYNGSFDNLDKLLGALDKLKDQDQMPTWANSLSQGDVSSAAKDLRKARFQINASSGTSEINQESLNRIKTVVAKILRQHDLHRVARRGVAVPDATIPETPFGST